MSDATGSFRGKRITVMGLGAFGGGEGATRYLAEQGAQVTVTDLHAEKDLADAVERLRDLPLTFHLGAHDERDFTGPDVVIVNPAVKPDSPFLALARRAGVRLDTEINLFLRACPATTVGVTGSNGKSTTTAMVDAMLRAAGRRTWMGGNVGGSLLSELGRIGPDDAVVLELSSFQLERLPWGGRAPHVGVALNVTPNHLDWHENMAAYTAAKRNLIAMQEAAGFAVLNEEDPILRDWADAGAGAKLWVGQGAVDEYGASWGDREIALCRGNRRDVVSLAALQLPGPHNRLNAACAASAAWLLGAPKQAIERALAEFRALPHRLEQVGVVDGVRYVEDSVATTPESTIAALYSFDVPIHLIAGGSPKGTPFADLGRAIAARAATVALIGQTADEIARAIGKAGPSAARVIRSASLQDAFDSLRAAAAPGDVVLLSPACASFGMFRNYLDRAEQFRGLVEAATAEGGLEARG